MADHLVLDDQLVFSFVGKIIISIPWFPVVVCGGLRPGVVFLLFALHLC